MKPAIPSSLVASCAKSAKGMAWLVQLPDLIYSISARWSLSLGAPFDGEDVVIATLLKRFWRVPPDEHHFRTLSMMISCCMDETRADEARWYTRTAPEFRGD